MAAAKYRINGMPRPPIGASARLATGSGSFDRQRIERRATILDPRGQAAIATAQPGADRRRRIGRWGVVHDDVEHRFLDAEPDRVGDRGASASAATRRSIQSDISCMSDRWCRNAIAASASWSTGAMARPASSVRPGQMPRHGWRRPVAGPARRSLPAPSSPPAAVPPAPGGRRGVALSWRRSAGCGCRSRRGNRPRPCPR